MMKSIANYFYSLSLIVMFILFIVSCEKEKTYQFKLNDGFNIFCKKYVEYEEYYSIDECCMMDDRQANLVKNGIKKTELMHIIIHPQSW